MKWLNDYRMRFVLIGIVAAMVLGSGSAKADFTFGEPTHLGATVNSSASDSMPYISADGLTLYFSSERPGGYGGGRDLWVTTRPTTEDLWTEPVNLGPTVNSSDREGRPCISSDGLSLYFNSPRPGGFGYDDLYVTVRVTVEDEWGPPANLGSTVNAPSNNDFNARISVDGRLLFFASSNRPGFGLSDLWVTRREAKNDDWGSPVNVGPPVNSSAKESGIAISTDGRTIYFNSDRPGGQGSMDLWQVPIIPIVDFNGDGIVDSADMCIIVNHWGEDYPLCDIGPMPWGDGIVDVQDLIVLAEHFFVEPGLVAHWKLDETEGNTAYDSIVDNDGMVNGEPVWQPEGGMVDGALQFDGIDDYVRTDFVLNPADCPFSVFAWINGGAPGQVIVSQQATADWLATDAEGNLIV